jgi:hypothetical protein
MPEADLVRNILKALRTRYPTGVFYKIHTGPYQERGVPDILGCVDGTFVGIEVKTPYNRKGTTRYQEVQLDRIHRAGGVSGVATSIKEALSIVANIK